MEVGNITKPATFKSFLHLSYKDTLTFFVTVLFNIFMRQTLTDDFWGLYRNMNCTFPLSRCLAILTKDLLNLFTTAFWSVNIFPSSERNISSKYLFLFCRVSFIFGHTFFEFAQFSWTKIHK